MCRRKYSIKATTFDSRGRVIAVAYNDYHKTHPLQKKYAEKVGLEDKQSLHAEVAVLIKSRKSDVYKIKIERYDKNGNPKLAKPCPICEMAINVANVSVVEYTNG